MNDDISELVAYIKVARRMLIFTGAGISTQSGIPDFRGPHGVWKRRTPVYYQDFMSSESARLEHWDYKLEGRAAILAAEPNSVHHAIVKLERAGKVNMVLTQNIDGLHSLAGTSRNRLVELHGTDSAVECQTCHWRGDPGPHLEYFRIHQKSPLCECGGFLKTATISFGQDLDPELCERARVAASRPTSLFLSVRHSQSIPPLRIH